MGIINCPSDVSSTSVSVHLIELIIVDRFQKKAKQYLMPIFKKINSSAKRCMMTSSTVSRCCSQHISEPASLHSRCTVYLCMCYHPGLPPPPFPGWGELPRGQTQIAPLGPCMPAIHLSSEPGSEPVCHIGDRLGRCVGGGGGWLRATDAS